MDSSMDKVSQQGAIAGSTRWASSTCTGAASAETRLACSSSAAAGTHRSPTINGKRTCSILGCN